MKNEFGTTGSTGLTENFASSARRIVTIDLEKYQGYLDGLDVSDERKEEFLRAMFLIVMTFVDLGCEVHPLQEVCGKERIGEDRLSKASVDEVRLAEPIQSSTRNSGPSGSLGTK